MDIGINELFEGLTITRGSDKYVMPPSSFAEAEVGLMGMVEIREGLEEVLDLVVSDESVNAPSIRHAIKRSKGTLSLESVIEKVKSHHERSGKLITAMPVKQADISGGGIWYFVIRRRGTERKERARQVAIGLDAEGNIIQYSCPCPTYRKNFAKGNYGALGGHSRRNPVRGLRTASAGMRDLSGFPVFNTFIACYHVGVGLTHISREAGLYKLPFEFTKVAVFEALFMDVFSGIKEAVIDDYLIRNGAITQETLRQISEGELTLEVVKHSKDIGQRANEIINGIKRARERDDYVFNGFATDFRGSPQQTASITLTKQDGRSVQILSDSRFGIELPFMMLNIPYFLWLSMGRAPLNYCLEGDPLSAVSRYFKRFDERIQQEVVSILMLPDRHLLTPGEVGVYNRLVRERGVQAVTLPS